MDDWRDDAAWLPNRVCGHCGEPVHEDVRHDAVDSLPGRETTTVLRCGGRCGELTAAELVPEETTETVEVAL